MVYDMDWNAYPEFVNSRCPISDIIPRPSALEEMKLSSPMCTPLGLLLSSLAPNESFALLSIFI